MVQNNIEKIKESDIFCYNELKANLFQCNLILPKSVCDNVCLNIAIFSEVLHETGSHLSIFVISKCEE